MPGYQSDTHLLGASARSPCDGNAVLISQAQPARALVKRFAESKSMTLEQPSVTTTPHRIVHHQFRRRATIVACAMAAALVLHATAEAAPMRFEFETTTVNGDPFGEGWFTIDDALFPYPHIVKSGWDIYPPGAGRLPGLLLFRLARGRVPQERRRLRAFRRLPSTPSRRSGIR